MRLVPTLKNDVRLAINSFVVGKTSDRAKVDVPLDVWTVHGTRKAFVVSLSFDSAYRFKG